MKAWRVSKSGEPREALALCSEAIEAPDQGELIVRVAASGLALPDVMLCRGTYSLLPPMPFTPGLEFVGEVVRAGPGTSTTPGTRVMGVAAFLTGRGAFAEHCKVQERAAYPAPADMTSAEAAAFTIAFHTGYIGLHRRAKLAKGESVLVTGAAGGTGYAAVQLAKAMGANVIATVGGRDKAEFCRKQGANLVLDHTQGDWVQAVKDATSGKGVDVVYDPVGGEMFERAFDGLAVEGRLLPVGFASGRRGDIPSALLNRRNASIVGVLGGGFPRNEMLEVHEALMRMRADGAIRTVVDHTIGFDAIPDGLEAISQRKVQGRIVALHE
jgi:NADPH2:quinone reductase